MSKAATDSRSVAPTDLPFAPTEVMQHLRVTDVLETSYIEQVTRAATAIIENFTGRAFMTQTFIQYWHGFPRVFELGHPPILSVTSIKYLDTAGDEQTLASSQYRSQLQSDVQPFIEPAFGITWPTTRGISNDVYVEYVAGYGTSGEEVPKPLRQAILLQVGDMYENRASTVIGVSTSRLHMTAELLAAPYVVLA